MAITHQDVNSMDNAFGNLQQTLLQNRALNQRRDELAAQRGQRSDFFDQNIDFRRQALLDRMLSEQDSNAIKQQQADASTTRAEAASKNSDTNARSEARKNKTQLFTDEGTSVWVPDDHVDSYKAAYEKSHSGKKLSETNTFEKTLNIGGLEVTFTDPASYQKAVEGQAKIKSNEKIAGAPRITTETDATPGKPAVDASSGIFGLGAHPAAPAIPAQPKTITSRKDLGMPIGDSGLPDLTGQPVSAPVTNAPVKLPQQIQKRVKVKGPNGQTGTVPEGSALPAGWSIIGA